MFHWIHLISLTQELFVSFCSIVAEQGTSRSSSYVQKPAGKLHSNTAEINLSAFTAPPSSKTTAK